MSGPTPEDGEDHADIAVLDETGTIRPARAVYSWGLFEAVVTVSVDAASWTGRSEHGFFDALIEVRQQCEPLGYRLLCWGASRDVNPSGMQRDFGGTSAYRMRVGAKPSLEDVVDIFAMNDAIEPATVEEQRAWAEVWFAHPRR